MMSELSVAWLLLEAAVIADEKLKGTAAEHPDHAFYTGKLSSALYFARNVLPGVLHKAELMGEEDKSAVEIPLASFATV